MRLISIKGDKYNQYRLDAMFDCYKWDPQFEDNNTVAPFAVVLSQKEHRQLVELTEALDEETQNAEAYINKHLDLTKKLALPKSMKKEISSMTNYNAQKHVRLMRYDFHPTVNGDWAVSEVNSDVPGGFAEASLLPKLAIKTIGKPNLASIDFSEILIQAIEKAVVKNGKIMMVHCTCYSDDRQVMQFLGDRLQQKGFDVIYGAADHVRFKKRQAYSILDNNETPLDGIVRFTPLEWISDIKPKKWAGYFTTVTPSCNHPIAMFAQTKRFPLIWNQLEKEGVSMKTWRQLLPHTTEVFKAIGKEGYIFKPACGRVGEKISIKEACKKGEYRKIMTDVLLHPSKYLAQKKFESKALKDEQGNSYHLCLGCYSVNGRHGGYYARISKKNRIDSDAMDIPVLIEGDEHE